MSMYRYGGEEIMCLQCDHCRGEWDSGTDRQHMDEGLDQARRIGWAWLGMDVNLCPRCAGSLPDAILEAYYILVDQQHAKHPISNLLPAPRRPLR